MEKTLAAYGCISIFQKLCIFSHESDDNNNNTSLRESYKYVTIMIFFLQLFHILSLYISILFVPL